MLRHIRNSEDRCHRLLGNHQSAGGQRDPDSAGKVEDSAKIRLLREGEISIARTESVCQITVHLFPSFYPAF